MLHFATLHCRASFPFLRCLKPSLQGVIFVWPDEHSSEEAARTPAPMPAALLAAGEGEGEEERGREPGSRANDGRIPSGFSCFMRDVPYGFEVLAENLLDPAHLPFAHHGVMQLNRSQAAPMRGANVEQEVRGDERVGSPLGTELCGASCNPPLTTV